MLPRPALNLQELAGSGTLLGRRYRLRVPIGQTARPGRWQAFDEVLSRPVIVQFLPPGASLAAPELAAVRAAARLTDPRIARIFDAHDSGDRPYLVCEHAPGQLLDQMLGTGPLDPALAAAITAEAASALAGAHAAGASHLCLTPRSLRYGETGLKITGLAVEAAAARVTDANPGVADSLALGYILYACLTGYWPGLRATGLPPAPRRHGRPYRPWQVREGIPAALNAITCRAAGLDLASPGSCFAGPASLAAALCELRAAPAWRHRPGSARARAATAAGPADPRRGTAVATEQRTGESTTPWLLSDCA